MSRARTRALDKRVGLLADPLGQHKTLPAYAEALKKLSDRELMTVYQLVEQQRMSQLTDAEFLAEWRAFQAAQPEQQGEG